MGIFIPFTSAQAHHAFAATFTNDTTTVEGYVTELKFNNPHVRVNFDVTDESGETTQWVSVGGSATTLRQVGWSRTTLQEGDYIRITGNTSRNGSPMVSMGTVEVLDPESGAVLRVPGTEENSSYAAVETGKNTVPMTLDNGLPNLTGYWVMGSMGRPSDSESAGGPPPGGMGAPEAGVDRGERAGGPPNAAEGPAPYNEVAAAIQAEVDLADDPQVQCELPGLVRQAGFTPHPVRIEQFDDRVVISYEEYGGVRTVYLDKRDMVGGEKTNLGQSWARYEEDKLIIVTNNLLSNWSSPMGQILSDQVSTVETYSRLPDVNGTSVLSMRMVITDPLYLTDTWSMAWQKYYSEGYEFIPVACEKPL